MSKQARTKLPEGTTQFRNAYTGEVKFILGKYFKEGVRKIALDSGFKYKAQDNGVMDLNPYVFDFAKELIESSNETLIAQVAELRGRLNDCVNDYIKNDKGNLTASVFHRAAVALEENGNE